jgi:tol-pal system protein YbgF
MSNPSKAWLIPICLFAYLSMGQAGCQTTPSNDITYVRSDIVRLSRDIDGLSKKIDKIPEAPDVNIDGVVRNQAAQREALLELKDGQERTESRIDETRHEVAGLKKEIENLKLNLIRQLEALRAQTKALAAKASAPAPQPAKQPKKAPAPVATKPRGQPASAKPKTTPSASKSVKPLDYTKLYDTAYDDYQQQNYSLARTGFAEYLRLFPETDLADNAQYWIGECYYAEGKYEEAFNAFQQVITKYPTGNKVPRAMLKAGHAQLQLGRKDQARLMFQQVIDAYPLSSEADQAKSRLKKLE